MHVRRKQRLVLHTEGEQLLRGPGPVVLARAGGRTAGSSVQSNGPLVRFCGGR